MPPPYKQEYRTETEPTNTDTIYPDFSTPSDKAEIEKLIKEYLKMGLIEVGHGPFASAILLVRKASGRHKIAVCLNTLNARSTKNSYPVPLIRDCLDFLANKP